MNAKEEFWSNYYGDVVRLAIPGSTIRTNGCRRKRSGSRSRRQVRFVPGGASMLDAAGDTSAAFSMRSVPRLSPDSTSCRT